jgi:multiple antibiotic resistance protein
VFETALTAFTTFFAVIGPIDSAVLLATLTPNMTGSERRAISLKAVLIATVIVLFFARSRADRSSASSACPWQPSR